MANDIECNERPRCKSKGVQFRAKIGDQQFEFREFLIDDPVPTGRQLLEAAGLRPAVDYLVFQVLDDGATEELRLDETTDLRSRGVEKFLAFKSDRSFRFVLDERRFEWGAASISGRALKLLARVNPAAHGVWLERTEEPDKLLADGDVVMLTGQGVERFRTGPLFFACIEDEIRPWPRSTITTEEIAQLGGWDPGLGVIEVDEDQNERTLAPGEVVELRPGLAFGKKLCWKRG